MYSAYILPALNVTKFLLILSNLFLFHLLLQAFTDLPGRVKHLSFSEWYRAQIIQLYYYYLKWLVCFRKSQYINLGIFLEHRRHAKNVRGMN